MVCRHCELLGKWNYPSRLLILPKKEIHLWDEETFLETHIYIDCTWMESFKGACQNKRLYPALLIATLYHVAVIPGPRTPLWGFFNVASIGHPFLRTHPYLWSHVIDVKGLATSQGERSAIEPHFGSEDIWRLGRRLQGTVPLLSCESVYLTRRILCIKMG